MKVKIFYIIPASGSPDVAQISYLPLRLVYSLVAEF